MPADAALVDLLEYQANSKRRIAAFVLRSDLPTAAVDLGPVENVAEAVQTWREAVVTNRPISAIQPADNLRRLIWQPLEPHLHGIRTVLVSPDGILAGLPFPALPGRTPGTYLIEEVSLAVVPTPQMVPQLQARDATLDDFPSVGR